MGRRSVHSPEELRQLILDASKNIIERNGVAGLSAREIARMIGYSPGTLYNIFENLDDVLLTLQVQLLGRIVEDLKQVPMGPSAETNIEALTDAYISFAMDNRHMWNLLFAHSVPGASHIPSPFYEHLNSIATIVSTALAPLVPGREPAQLDATTRALWAGVHGIASIAATEKGHHLTPATAPSYARELISTFVKGLNCR